MPNRENFSEGFVIGFDPCTGIGNPNGGIVAFAMRMVPKGDTIIAYNFPAGIYDFPLEYFISRFQYFFPDSAAEYFPVKIKYRYAKQEELFLSLAA